MNKKFLIILPALMLALTSCPKGSISSNDSSGGDGSSSSVEDSSGSSSVEPIEYTYTIDAEIPSLITITDTIIPSVEVVVSPIGGEIPEYEITVDGTVLTYDVISKVITPLKTGTGYVEISLVGIEEEVKEHFDVEVVSGVNAPQTLDAFTGQLQTLEASAYLNASDIAYSYNKKDYEYENNSSSSLTYKLSDNGYSISGQDTSYGETDTIRILNLITEYEGNKTLFELSDEGDGSYDKSAEFRKILTQEEYDELSGASDFSYYNIVDTKAFDAIALNLFDDNNIYDNLSVSEYGPQLVSFEAVRSGDEITVDVHISEDYFTSWGTSSVTHYEYGAKYTRFGDLLSLTLHIYENEAVYETEVETDKCLNEETITFNFTYNERHNEETLDFAIADFFATELSVHYETYDTDYAPNLAYVGTDFFDSNFEVDSSAPEGAANLIDLVVEIIDGEETVDTSGYYIEFIAEGNLSVRVKPRWSINDVYDEVVIKVETAKPEEFNSASLTLRPTYLFVGETSEIAASLSPSYASQDYTVTTTSSAVTLSENSETGIWTVTADSPQEDVTLTLTSDVLATVTTTLTFDVREQSTEVDMSVPAGDYTGTVGSIEVTANLDDTNGTVFNSSGDTYFTFTYTFDDASGNMTIDLKDGNYWFDEETYTFNYDSSTGTITGEITADVGNYNDDVNLVKENPNAVDMSVPKGEYEGTMTRLSPFNVTASIDDTSGQIYNGSSLVAEFTYTFDEIIKVMKVTVTSDTYEGSYSWIYDSSTGVITGNLIDPYESYEYDLKLTKIVPSSGVDFSSIEGTFEGTTSSAHANIDTTLTLEGGNGKYLYGDLSFTFTYEYDESNGEVKVSVINGDSFLGGESYTWNYNNTTGELTGAFEDWDFVSYEINLTKVA